MLRLVQVFHANVTTSRRLWARPATALGVALVTLSCGDTQGTSQPVTTPGVTTDGAPTTTSPGTSTAGQPAASSGPVSPTSPSTSSAASSSAAPTTTAASSAPQPSSSAPSSSSQPTPDPSTGAGSDDEGSQPNVVTEPSSDVTSAPPASEANPSPGCAGGNANAALPSGAVVNEPNDYDGATPVPVLFAFHGAGGNASSLQGNFSNDATSRGYLGVYLKSSGSAWSIQADTAVLDAAYDTISKNYCVDLNRVFAVGHSSGAQMITQLLCAKEDRFRAVAPVASSKYCNGWDATPAIVIHGVDDIERGGQGLNRYGLDDGDGHIDFGVYRNSNQCSEASTAFEPGGNCGANIDPGCVEYNECAARTVFCNHNDPQYGTSNHGVPCFASKAMFDFFDSFQ